MSLAVRSSFTKDWQDLDADSSDDDDTRARKAASAAALREELGFVVNAENLVVLAGLGASLSIVNKADSSLKAPRMSDLWAKVEVLPSFKAIEGLFPQDLISGKNLEHLLSNAQARLALDPGSAPLAKFVSEAENVVWTSCSFINSDSEVDSHELFLRKVGRRSTRLQRTQIFTTNYDLAFELAARRARFNVIDGFGYGAQSFDGASFDLDYVRRRTNEPLALEPSVVHLLKLHGSVDWDAAAGDVVKVSRYARPADPVLIYPSSAKFQLSFRQPYLEFMSRFQIALRQSDVGLIVVGSGLNDEHLVAPIESALRGNVGLRAVFVTPGANDKTRSPMLTWVDSLVEKGDRRLTLVAGTFDDLVRLLPDVPTWEERDAHAERISAKGRV